MCNSKRTPRAQALIQGCPSTSTGLLAGTQAHFKHDSATEHVSDSFQLTFPEKSCFPELCQHIQHTVHCCCRSLPANPPSEALAAKPQHLAPGQFPSRQKFTISRESTPFPWNWLWATRCGCSCTHCFGQNRDQITLESRPEQAFAIYKLII